MFVLYTVISKNRNKGNVNCLVICCLPGHRSNNIHVETTHDVIARAQLLLGSSKQSRNDLKFYRSKKVELTGMQKPKLIMGTGVLIAGQSHHNYILRVSHYHIIETFRQK